MDLKKEYQEYFEKKWGNNMRIFMIGDLYRRQYVSNNKQWGKTE